MEPFNAQFAARQSAWASPPFRFTIFGGLFFLFLLQYAVGVFSSQLRDLRYLLPPLALAIVMFTGVRLTPTRRVALAFLVRAGLLLAAMVLLSLGVQFIQGNVYPRFLKEAYFLLGPILFTVVLFCYSKPEALDKYVDWAFYVLIITFVFLVKGELITALVNPLQLLFGLLTSKVFTETPHSPYFGLLFIYYLFGGRNKYAILSFLFLSLSFKRIAILGAVGTLVVVGLLKVLRLKLPKNRTAIAILATFFNLLILLVIYHIAQGSFDAFIKEQFGMATHAFTAGRQTAYAVIFNAVGTVPLLGIGVGGTSAIMAESSQHLALAHSDILKLFIEFGPVLFVIYMIYMYRLYGRSYQTLAMMIYLNILYLTGNSLIYFSVICLQYCLVSIIMIRSIHNNADGVGM